MSPDCRTATAQVPGKIMLAGEYVVLDGGAALAATVSKTLRITITKSTVANGQLSLRSDLWPEVLILDDHLQPSTMQQPMVEAARWCAQHYELRDVDISVTSALDVAHGAGSSSALRYGLLLAAAAYSEGIPDANTRWDLARHAWSLQSQGQYGLSSGYDIATQNLGGLVCMHPATDPRDWPGMVTRMSQGAAWLNRYAHIYTGGKGAPTGPLVKAMQPWLDHEGRRQTLSSAAQILVSHLCELVATNDAPTISLFRDVRQLRNIINQSPAALPWRDGIEGIAGLDQTWTYKTTGAGGDDAIIVFADSSTNDTILRPALAALGMSPAPFAFANQRAEVFIQ